MTVYDCIVIGGGPAGLTACLYAARAGLRVCFFEKYLPGGKLNKTFSIENYPGYLENSGPQLGDLMLSQVTKIGVEEISEEVVDISGKELEWTVKTKNGKSYVGKTVLITSGMKERVLDIPNAKEYYGKGVSYCAICDGNLYPNSKVIVIGGGDSAVEESIYLSKLTKGVEIIHRRNEFKATPIIVDKMKQVPNINVNKPYFPQEIKVVNDKVVGVVVKHAETGEIKLIEGDGVFCYIGLVPENYFLSNLGLEMSESGFIKVDNHMKTSVKGIWAAGDIVSKPLRQVVTASGEGATAAISIKDYISNI